MSHKYLTGDGRCKKLPKILAIPYYYSSKILGLPLILTLFGLLHNWSLKDKTKPFSLYNLKINHTVYNNESEIWFYLVTIAIEQNSGKLCKLLPEIYENMKKSKNNELKRNINMMNNLIDSNIEILSTLNKNTCDPYIFYNHIRPLLEGYDNKDIYPNGLLLEDIDHDLIDIKGGSAGQSTFIQILDILYGIEYTDKKKEFILNVRNSMTSKQREFIRFIEELPKLKEYIIKENNKELLDIYNDGILLISNFRKIHYRIIYQYIYTVNKNSYGTGGTIPLSFSKEMIQNTENHQITNRYRKWKHNIIVSDNYSGLFNKIISIFIQFMFLLFIFYHIEYFLKYL